MNTWKISETQRRMFFLVIFRFFFYGRLFIFSPVFVDSFMVSVWYYVVFLKHKIIFTDCFPTQLKKPKYIAYLN